MTQKNKRFFSEDHIYRDLTIGLVLFFALSPVLDWMSVRDVSNPSPLDDGGQNAFRAPLRTPRV